MVSGHADRDKFRSPLVWGALRIGGRPARAGKFWLGSAHSNDGFLVRTFQARRRSGASSVGNRASARVRRCRERGLPGGRSERPVRQADQPQRCPRRREDSCLLLQWQLRPIVAKHKVLPHAIATLVKTKRQLSIGSLRRLLVRQE